MAEKRDTTGFGDRLREMRKAKGLSQEQLAELSGMKPSAVARLERGERTPGWETVIRLAAVLKVTTDKFRPSG